jgi:dTDP-4-dehydrorhamnose 3,5-epimerase
MKEVASLALPELRLITPPLHGDARGWLMETWRESLWREFGVPGPFVQDNQSFSAAAGTLRGLHCQVAPAVQGKLVRVLRGAIWDVAVDVRHGSPTFGRHVAAVLSAANWAQLWVPAGFLHGFCTVEPETEVIYKVTAPYDRAAERGVAWDDPALGIPWPVDQAAALLSDKDRVLPRLADCPVWFRA